MPFSIARCLRNIERAEDCVFGRAARPAVVDRIDQHRHPKNVGQQDKLLAPFGAHLPGVGQEIDRCQPLLVGRLDFLDCGMQVLDQHRHDLAQPWINVGAHAGVDHVDRGGFLEVGIFLERPAFLASFMAVSSSLASRRYDASNCVLCSSCVIMMLHHASDHAAWPGGSPA